MSLEQKGSSDNSDVTEWYRGKVRKQLLDLTACRLVVMLAEHS